MYWSTGGIMINECSLVIHTFVPDMIIIDYILPKNIDNGFYFVSSGWKNETKKGEVAVIKITKSIFDFSTSAKKRLHFDNLENVIKQHEEEVDILRRENG